MSTLPARTPERGEAHWTDLDQDAIVLGLLLECQDDFVSGPILCDKLDVPRAELLQRIDSLRQRGYVIQSAGGRGYRLLEIPDGIGEAQIAPLLSTSLLGRTIHSYEQLGSTNDEAHRLADAGAADGEVVIAETQTSGRGRRGRTWFVAPGESLALSVVLRPALPPQRAPEITLAAAVAVCEAARGLGVRDARIKWPNDIEVRGAKLAGLLTELRAEVDGIRHAVLGIGLNVNVRDFPDGIAATSLLHETGERVPRPLVVAALLERLEEWLESLETEGFTPVRERWKELSSTLGRRVKADAVEGDAVDLAPDGALVVRTGTGELLRVVAGDVEHCRVM